MLSIIYIKKEGTPELKLEQENQCLVVEEIPLTLRYPGGCISKDCRCSVRDCPVLMPLLRMQLDLK